MAVTIDKDLEQALTLLKQGTDIDKALKMINKSAKSGTTKGKSYYEIARIIREGVPGLLPNPEESKRYADAAMGYFIREDRDSLDLRYMADYYYYGYGSEQVDFNKALELYEKGQAAGDDECAKKADEIRQKLSDVSASSAQYLNSDTVNNIGTQQANNGAGGIGVDIFQAPSVVSDNDPVITDNPTVIGVIESERLTLKAIAMLDDEKSTVEELLDAIDLAKQAANLESVRAMNLLGFIYESENGVVDRDPSIAKAYYERAVSLNSSVAMFRLGLLLLDVDNVFADVERAHNLILRSARAGYSIALCYLGDCFREKVSDPRNLEVAYRYYAMSGERGYGLGYHYMSEIDASRNQMGAAEEHERMAKENGYDLNMGYQDPLFMSLHL